MLPEILLELGQVAADLAYVGLDLDELPAVMAAVGDARPEVIDNAAHLANVEHPDTVNQLIIDHLEST